MIQLKIVIDLKPKGQSLNIPESISKIEKQEGMRPFLSALISLRLPHDVHSFPFQICVKSAYYKLYCTLYVLVLAYFKKAGESRVESGLSLFKVLVLFTNYTKFKRIFQF